MHQKCKSTCWQLSYWQACHKLPFESHCHLQYRNWGNTKSDKMSVLLNEPFAFMKLGPLLILLALREETGKHKSELLQLLCWQAGRQMGKSKTEGRRFCRGSQERCRNSLTACLGPFHWHLRAIACWRSFWSDLLSYPASFSIGYGFKM